ncbi:MAG: hypothetical protein MUF72_06205 [Elainella sp. Prado103]|jgi:hypothetical protein|nr:hypothetical protein [Elainella sp. Prado103]
MSDFQLPEFLTYDEVVEVDKALLTAQDKFLTRVSLYSLRVLKQIAATEQRPIAQIDEMQIAHWIGQDPTLKQAIGTDDTFLLFFTRIVLSSLQPLQQVAETTATPIDQLSIQQVVGWFEHRAKSRFQTEPSSNN